MKYNILLICIFLSFTSYVNGRNYYIDSKKGNDFFDGSSETKAWKSLDKINQTTVFHGDSILLKCGSVFSGQLILHGSGTLFQPIIIDCYGNTGSNFGLLDRPRINAEGKFKAALYLFNVQNCKISNLELTNLGATRSAGRTGAYIHLKNFGEAKNIRLSHLYIHDVNGSHIKKEGGGQGILIQNEGDSIPTRFNGLTVEFCTISKTERNGIIFESGYWHRDKWHPNLNVVVRKNLIEQVPGDGIVPIGCDGALVEYNLMRDCTRLLPDGEAAAGIWPWSCDNTIIQYNEVSDHKAPWDGQGFDADWNCRNTTIQYNYSHDNEGGFLLICSPTDVKLPENIGNDSTVIRYNLSVNDGLRNSGKHAGFSPVFHISGPVTHNKIYNNTIAVFKKPQGVDRNIVKMDTWGGAWPDNSYFTNNIFYSTDSVSYDFGKATNTKFENNLYYGVQINRPADIKALFADPLFERGTEKIVGADAPLFVASKETGVDMMYGFRLQASSPCIGKGIQLSSNGEKDISSTQLPVNFCAIGAFDYNYTPEMQQAAEERIKWWRGAKFGLFLHWGVYSVYGGTYKGKSLHSAEWIQDNAHIPWTEYEQTAKTWNPDKFNADEWIAHAKNAGMKYIVITAKHHDGYAMYPTALSPYNIKDWSAYNGADPIMELKKACEKANIGFGIYYSTLEFRTSPKGILPEDKQWIASGHSMKELGSKPYINEIELAELAKSQIKELLEKYNPDILWYDGSWCDLGRWTPWDATETDQYIRSNYPKLIINPRARSQFPDFTNAEGESALPETTQINSWEFCWNLGVYWGYNPNNYTNPDLIKTPEHYLRTLINVASKGGNYLLNVGPQPSGQLPPVAVAYLDSIGSWLKINGEAIYGTKAGPFDHKPEWGYATSGENKIYLIIDTAIQKKAEIILPELKGIFRSASLLSDIHKKKLKSRNINGLISILLPDTTLKAQFPVIVLQADSDR
jgi:alpha-L-fucosidase